MTDKTNEGVDGAHWSAIEEAVELLHEERFGDAMVELRRALQSDPKNPYAYYFLGIAFFESGEIEAARDAYSACLKLAPAHLGAR
ncbi:MAG TPA: tetratricopeptide repeat protein, partial [Polyangiaceae bacterium]|nr:tetratricopeptide repeat protein [Polyangiaceae bacterium]